MLPVHSLMEAHKVPRREALHSYPFSQWEEDLGRKGQRISKTVVTGQGWNSQLQRRVAGIHLPLWVSVPQGAGSHRSCLEVWWPPMGFQGWFRPQLLHNRASD